MLQQTIHVPNGDFWNAFEELGDQTYEQEVTINLPLAWKLKESSDECRTIGEHDCLLSWNGSHMSPSRTIVLAREIRDGVVYYKALLIQDSNSERGFRHAVNKCKNKKEFLFVEG